MGWERRKQGPSTGYYYRSIRLNGRVKKVYLGRGAAGQEAAAVVERKRQARLQSQAAVLAEHDETADADRLAGELADWADLLTAVWLLAAGHHHHRGEWRRNHRGQERS